MNISGVKPSFSLRSPQNKTIDNRTKISLRDDLYISKPKSPTFCAVPNYKVVDMTTWTGKGVYDRFMQLQNPFVGGTMEVDIKNLAKLAKEKRTTVNTLVMYAIGKATNSISQFRLRLLDEKLVEFDKSCLGMTVPARGKQGYVNFCNIDFDPNLDKFIQNVRTVTTEGKNRKEVFPSEHRPDAVYLSHVDGHYTALNNPNGGKFDLVPRINWGSPKRKSGIALFAKKETLIPITIEGHHSIISGYHISKFIEVFQNTCNNELKVKSLKDRILESLKASNI